MVKSKKDMSLYDSLLLILVVCLIVFMAIISVVLLRGDQCASTISTNKIGAAALYNPNLRPTPTNSFGGQDDGGGAESVSANNPANHKKRKVVLIGPETQIPAVLTGRTYWEITTDPDCYMKNPEWPDSPYLVPDITYDYWQKKDGTQCCTTTMIASCNIPAGMLDKYPNGRSEKAWIVFDWCEE